MSNQILVPSLGESVTEVTVSKWFKQIGEKVDSDEPLVELETDKVNVEVPSPLAGTLSSIKVKEGDTVEVGALLGIISEGKSILTKAIKTKSVNQDQESYIPPKTIEKKNLVKKAIKKSKKISSNKQETLTLVEESRDENSNGTLILDTLADEGVKEIKEEKYIPPKTRQYLSPSVRKIVEEKNIIKKTLKKRKKIISEKKEPLTLIDESKDKDSNGALILDILADEDANETKEEKYIPPKTREYLL